MINSASNLRYFEELGKYIQSYNAQPVSISQIKPNLTQFSSDKFFGMRTMVRGHVNSSSLMMIIMGNITQHNQQRDAHPMTLELRRQIYNLGTGRVSFRPIKLAIRILGFESPKANVCVRQVNTNHVIKILEGSLNPSVVSKIQIANQFVLKSGSVWFQWTFLVVQLFSVFVECTEMLCDFSFFVKTQQTEMPFNFFLLVKTFISRCSI